MTALSASRQVRRLAPGDIAIEDYYLPLAAAAVVYQGGLVGVNVAGNLVPASADPTLTIIGVAEADTDNTAGIAGAKSVAVTRGTFPFVNAAGTDAVTVAQLQQPCYAVDDQTVSASFALGTRPRAGKVVQIDSDGTVWVETMPTINAERDIVVLAGADLSASQFFAVKLDNTGKAILAVAGDFCAGVVQNAPANAAAAIVRISGTTKLIGGGAVAIGSLVASDAAGKGKVAGALVQATGAGSNVLGIALTLGAAATAFNVLITHSGVTPTSVA